MKTTSVYVGGDKCGVVSRFVAKLPHFGAFSEDPVRLILWIGHSHLFLNSALSAR